MLLKKKNLAATVPWLASSASKSPEVQFNLNHGMVRGEMVYTRDIQSIIAAFVRDL